MRYIQDPRNSLQVKIAYLLNERHGYEKLNEKIRIFIIINIV